MLSFNRDLATRRGQVGPHIKVPKNGHFGIFTIDETTVRAFIVTGLDPKPGLYEMVAHCYRVYTLPHDTELTNAIIELLFPCRCRRSSVGDQRHLLSRVL